MTGETRTFQYILLGIFLLLGVGGVLFFAMYGGFGGSENPYGNKVLIWGTLDDAPFAEAIEEIGKTDKDFDVVTYVEKDPRTFESELVNALAEGKGPDLVVLPHDMLVGQRGKLWPIPFDQYPVRTFKDTYIDGAEIFLLQDGVYALPIAVDPLMMYWNRDIFATQGLANPPRTWEELVGNTIPAIVERTFTHDISRAAAALGEYQNIRNAKEILLALLLQAGSTLVTADENGFDVELDQGADQALAPGTAAMRFYSEFSNPAKNVYTWNRAMPEDRSAFLAGDLALYFGFASEYEEVREGNPNLSFDIAELPQNAAARLKKGYGTFYGMGLLRNAANPNGAYRALFRLAEEASVQIYARDLRFGPVHRVSYSALPQDPILTTVARASLIARGWLDPDQDASENIFKQLIDDVVSGRQDISSALDDAEGRLRLNF